MAKKADIKDKVSKARRVTDARLTDESELVEIGIKELLGRAERCFLLSQSAYKNDADYEGKLLILASAYADRAEIIEPNVLSAYANGLDKISQLLGEEDAIQHFDRVSFAELLGEVA